MSRDITQGILLLVFMTIIIKVRGGGVVMVLGKPINLGGGASSA